MFGLKILFFLLPLWLMGCVFLMAQETTPLDSPKKEKPVEDQPSGFDDVSTSDYLNAKPGDKTQGDKGLFGAPEKTRVTWGSYFQMFVVLVFVLFLIFLFFYFSKNKFRKNLLGLNGIEVLAKASLLPKQTLLLVRIGPRVLVLNATADGNMRTLTEFKDAEEIAQLLSDINKNSRDNIFQSLLTRNKVLYDEEAANEDSALNKIDKQTDKLQS